MWDGGAGCLFLHADATLSAFYEAFGVTDANFSFLFEILTCGRVEKVTHGDLYHTDDKQQRESGVEFQLVQIRKFCIHYAGSFGS